MNRMQLNERRTGVNLMNGRWQESKRGKGGVWTEEVSESLLREQLFQHNNKELVSTKLLTDDMQSARFKFLWKQLSEQQFYATDRRMECRFSLQSQLLENIK